jgi:putative transposase
LVKGVRAQGWSGEGYRALGRRAIADVLRGEMDRTIAERLNRMAVLHDGQHSGQAARSVVAAFHARPLREPYRVLMLDGVVLARKNGAGAIRRPVLVALGLPPDGRMEVIDFSLAHSESALEWERSLGDLIRRGLAGDGLERICVDGGSGLLAALPTACPGIPVQHCWAHKMRNVLAKGRQADQLAVKAGLKAVINARTLPQAGLAARHFVDCWEADCPKAVACRRDDLDQPLTCGAANPAPSAKRAPPPTPSSAAAARSDDEPGPKASSPTAPRWTASCSPSAVTKNVIRAVSTPLLMTQTF